MTKLSLWLTVHTAMLERKETKPQQKKLMCVNYTTVHFSRFLFMVDVH